MTQERLLLKIAIRKLHAIHDRTLYKDFEIRANVDWDLLRTCTKNLTRALEISQTSKQ